LRSLFSPETKIVNGGDRAIDGATARINGFPLDQAPPMQVASDWPATDVERLWNYVAATWTNLGASDPYWSVLTDDAFHLDKLDDQGIQRFFASGKHDVDRMHSWFARHNRAVPFSGTIAEYGCGVGSDA